MRYWCLEEPMVGDKREMHAIDFVCTDRHHDIIVVGVLSLLPTMGFF